MNHLVFVCDVFFDSVKVVWSSAEVFFLKIVSLFFAFFGIREDVLNGVGDDEIFVRFQALNRFITNFGNNIFFVSAIIRKVSD